MRHLWNQPMISIHWTQFSSDCNFSWRLLGFFKKSQRKMKNYRHYQRSSYSWRDELFMFSDSLQTGFLVRKMRHILHPAFLSAHWKMRTRTPVCAKKKSAQDYFFSEGKSGWDSASFRTEASIKQWDHSCYKYLLASGTPLYSSERTRAARVMPTRAASVCVRARFLVQTTRYRRQNARSGLLARKKCSVAEEWMFLSTLSSSLSWFAPLLSLDLTAFPRSSNCWRLAYQDAGRGDCTVGSASVSTFRFIPMAEWTGATSPISWVSS